MDSDNSGPWSSLARQASPFALSIYLSADKYRLYIGIGFVTVILLLPLSVQTLVFAAFAGFCLLALYACTLSADSGEKTLPLTAFLMISSDGYCRFDRGPVLRLLTGSRVGFSGCWLILTDELQAEAGGEIRQPLRGSTSQPACCVRFIFKDSLSTQDFARLSRVILSLKVHQKGTAFQDRQALK